MVEKADTADMNGTITKEIGRANLGGQRRAQQQSNWSIVGNQ